MPTQNVNLTSELERFVKSEVASGLFNSASEVHRAALADMARRSEERQMRLERLRLEIQKGLDSSAEGRTVEVSGESILSEMMDSCLDRAMDRLEAENAEPLS
jgi:antitoxin ParD1/3/4